MHTYVVILFYFIFLQIHPEFTIVFPIFEFMDATKSHHQLRNNLKLMELETVVNYCYFLLLTMNLKLHKQTLHKNVPQTKRTFNSHYWPSSSHEIDSPSPEISRTFQKKIRSHLYLSFGNRRELLVLK